MGYGENADLSGFSYRGRAIVDFYGIKHILSMLGQELPGDASVSWVNCSCPFARWTHSGGTDRKPSAGFSVHADKPSMFYCFSCSHDGIVLTKFVQKMWLLSREYPKDIARFVLMNEISDGEYNQEKKKSFFRDPYENIRKNNCLKNSYPQSLLNQYPILSKSSGRVSLFCREYLKSRGISKRVIEKFKIRYSPKNQTIVFPLTDKNGVIYVLRERSINEKKMWTVNSKTSGYDGYDFPRLSEKGVWFGLQFLDRSKPPILVEGEIDALRLYSLGLSNVIASAATSVTKAQLSVLACPTIVLGYDADNAGRLAMGRIRNFMRGKANIIQLDWESAGCKDPGELKTKDQIRKVFSSKTFFRFDI